MGDYQFIWNGKDINTWGELGKAMYACETKEDAEDLKRIRHEPTRPLSQVLKELKLDGTL